MAKTFLASITCQNRLCFRVSDVYVIFETCFAHKTFVARGALELFTFIIFMDTLLMQFLTAPVVKGPVANGAKGITVRLFLVKYFLCSCKEVNFTHASQLASIFVENSPHNSCSKGRVEGLLPITNFAS